MTDSYKALKLFRRDQSTISVKLFDKYGVIWKINYIQVELCGSINNKMM